MQTWHQSCSLWGRMRPESGTRVETRAGRLARQVWLSLPQASTGLTSTRLYRSAPSLTGSKGGVQTMQKKVMENRSDDEMKKSYEVSVLWDYDKLWHLGATKGTDPIGKVKRSTFGELSHNCLSRAKGIYLLDTIYRELLAGRTRIGEYYTYLWVVSRANFVWRTCSGWNGADGPSMLENYGGSEGRDHLQRRSRI